MLSLNRKYYLIIYLLIAVLLLALTVYAIYKLNIYLKNENLLIYATGTNEKAFLNSTWKMSPKEIERANKTNLSNSYNENSVFESIRISFDFPQILNMNRYSHYIQKDVLLWEGYGVYVNYYFFDNMLFEYNIKLENYPFKQIPSDIILTLRSRFGNEKKATMRFKGLSFADLLDIREEDKKEQRKQNTKEIDPLEELEESVRQEQATKPIEITGKDINLERGKYPYSFNYVWETQNQIVTLRKSKSRVYCSEIGYDFENNCKYYDIYISARYKNLYKEIEEISRQERDNYF